MKKKLSIFCLTYILAFPNLYAQSGYNGTSVPYKSTTDKTMTNKTTTTTTTGTTTPADSMNSDVIGTSQSSTKSTNCINVESGTLCGSKATTWCNNHMSAMECRKLHDSSIQKSEKDKEKDSSTTMPSSGY